MRDASLSRGRIVYQVGADLWLYTIASDASELVPVTLASDFDQLREKWVSKPMEYLTSAHLHPNGESVVLTARGRVFVAPAGDGRFVRASRKPGVRYRDVVFMPDGEQLLGLTDETGELEFASIPANGVGDATPLTDDGTILRFSGHPSPDGDKIAYTDNNRDLWLFDVATKEQTLVSTNREGVADITWSPDGSLVVYTQNAPNSFAQIFLYRVEDGVRVAATSDRVNSRSPSFSADGSFLYFLSDRDLRSTVTSPWGPRQPEPYFDAPIKIYEIALRTGLRSPFKPKDELAPETSPETSDDTSDEDVPVELDGIERRLKELAVASGAYRGLSVSEKTLFWLAREGGREGKWHLKALPITNEKPEPVTVVEDVRTFELSRNGNKLLVRKSDDLYVFDAEPKAVAELKKHQVDLSGFRFSIDVREDWRQLLIDAWRLERDYFYDPGMHGVDWDAALEKYAPLVDRIGRALSSAISSVVSSASYRLSTRACAAAIIVAETTT